MNPANFTWETDAKLIKAWGNASVVTDVICEAWLEVTSSLSMMDVWRYGHNFIDSALMPIHIDAMWFQTDLVLWEAAKGLDKPGEPGRVAKELGLINPHDPYRPTFTSFIFRSLDPKNGRIEPAKTPAPAPTAFVEAIPVASGSDSAVQSGHAFRAENKDSKPKPKVKTRGKDTPSENITTEDANDHDHGLSNLPDSLPTEYKMGRKVLKVHFLSRDI